ncbi:hypothetical protein HOH15_07595 [Candidatus Woesearchaeota archaeon]|nr:hypothetical protein [Candidatus Woesearchaeota archaeon]
MAKKLKPHPLDKHHVTHYAIFVCMIVAMVVFIMSFGSGPLVGKAFVVSADQNFPMTLSFNDDGGAGLTLEGGFSSPVGDQHLILGEILNGKITVTTVIPDCGDGVQQGIEDCDDGVDNGDGCILEPGEVSCDYCTINCGIETNTPNPTVCGDGTQEGTEQCDDGANVDGDGCSANCMIEDPTLAACPLDGMQSYWKGEDNVEDSIFNLAGTMENGASYTGGLSGQAFNFVKVNNEYAILAPANEMLAPGPFTIMLWFKTDYNHPVYNEGEKEGRLITFKRDVPNLISSSLSLYVEQDKVSYLYYDGGTHLKKTYTKEYDDSLWHLLTLTYDHDSGEFNYYFDLEHLGTIVDVFPFSLSTAPALLGSFDGGSRFFQGQIDEVAIFYKELIPPEITEHYNNGINNAEGYCEVEIQEEVCGNGIQTAGEVCDLGAQNDVPCGILLYGQECEECNDNCQTPVTLFGPYCGDATHDIGDEECDDGNLNEDDACKNDCTLTVALDIDFDVEIIGVTDNPAANTVTVSFDLTTTGVVDPGMLPIIELDLISTINNIVTEALGVNYEEGVTIYNAVFNLGAEFDQFIGEGFTANVFVDVNNDYPDETEKNNNYDSFVVDGTADPVYDFTVSNVLISTHDNTDSISVNFELEEVNSIPFTETIPIKVELKIGAEVYHETIESWVNGANNLNPNFAGIADYTFLLQNGFDAVVTVNPESWPLETDYSNNQETAVFEPVVDADGDSYFSNVDCDDNDPYTNPGEPEYCDIIDHNCDGNAKENSVCSCNEDSIVGDINRNGLFQLNDVVTLQYYFILNEGPFSNVDLMCCFDVNRDNLINSDDAQMISAVLAKPDIDDCGTCDNYNTECECYPLCTPGFQCNDGVCE